MAILLSDLMIGWPLFQKQKILKCTWKKFLKMEKYVEFKKAKHNAYL